MDITKIEQGFSPTPDGKCSEASGGMVATAFPDATRAGVEMLKQGGNAVDAACAAAFALGVCEPQASGLGGQTMAILHINGKAVALNGSGRVPSLGHWSRFSNGDLVTGYRSTTVPSTPAVLGHLHRKYGKLKWAKIVVPAIEIAKNGYRITQLQHDLQKRELSNFEQVESGTGARYFLRNGNKPYTVGELFRQPELARLLEIIAQQGPEAFYTGKVAQMIDEDMRAHNGFLRADDLAYIPWPVEYFPVQAAYKGLTILTMPPPSPGRIMVLMLKIFDRLHQARSQLSSLQKIRFLAETIRHVLLEHRRHPIRYELYEPLSDPVLNDEKYIHNLMMKILEGSKNPTEPNFEDFKGGETTHLSVMDRDGTAVGLTQSVNLVYGSKAAAEGLGFLYNNYLADSITDQPDHPHFLRPNGIPVSTVCPTIVLRNHIPWLVVGSPGSERIISTVAQFLLHIIAEGLPIDEAMRLPRLHCSSEGIMSLEFERFDREAIAYLAEAGYEIVHREPYAFYHGAIHAVLKRQTGAGFQGVAEIRRDGTAQGCEYQ